MYWECGLSCNMGIVICSCWIKKQKHSLWTHCQGEDNCNLQSIWHVSWGRDVCWFKRPYIMWKSRQRALKSPTATIQPLGAAKIDTREHIHGNRKSLKHPCEGNWNTHTHTEANTQTIKIFRYRLLLCRTEYFKNAQKPPHRNNLRGNCSSAAMNSFSHGSDVWAVPLSLVKPIMSVQLTCKLSTKVLLWQTILSWQKFCRDKRRDKNNTCGSSRQW